MSHLFMSDAQRIIERLRAEGKLSALPIGPVNWDDMTVQDFDGRVFRPYGMDGTWVEDKELEDGAIRYLGSASHAGKIEFKSLYVLVGGMWHNILNGSVQDANIPAAPSSGSEGKRG